MTGYCESNASAQPSPSRHSPALGEREFAALPSRCLTFYITTMARADTIQLYAAGSLKAALTDVAKAYRSQKRERWKKNSGRPACCKKEIAGGAKADIFASANMEHPQALNDDGTAGRSTLFARNKLCALVKPGSKSRPKVCSRSMLDDKVKLATSTPRADPSGDYALKDSPKPKLSSPARKRGWRKRPAS